MNADVLKPNLAQHSFNELALSYVARHAASMTDLQLNRRLEHLASYLLVFFGAHNLRDISPVKLKKFTYHLESIGLKPQEIEACMVSFRVCVRHAIQQHWDIDPCLLKAGVLDDGFQSEPIRLTEQEFTNLYQDLLQDLTSDQFH